MLLKGSNYIWKACIGLEIHAQVIVKSKLFSKSSLPSYESCPNSCVSLFDVGTPGTYPVLNKCSVDQAIKASLLLNCKINKVSQFDRKHYFYHDMPVGYQITQHKKPISENGQLIVDVSMDTDKTARRIHLDVERIQIEQDSGKSTYHPINGTLIDLNRAGSTLLEVVFAPQLYTSRQAVAAVNTIQSMFRNYDICDGKLEKGSLRCDVNVSVSLEDKTSGEKITGQRVEIKNLNSTGNIEHAIEYEVMRQVKLLEGFIALHPDKVIKDITKMILPETRGYNDSNKTTVRLRSKETNVDYRIFPDPDLPMLSLSDEDIMNIKNSMRSNDIILAERVEEMKLKYDLDESQILLLMNKPAYLKLFEDMGSELLGVGVSGKLLFQWAYNEYNGLLNKYYNDYETMIMLAKGVRNGEVISTSTHTPVLPNILTSKQFITLLKLIYVDNVITPLQGKMFLKSIMECYHLEQKITSEMDVLSYVQMNGWLKSTEDDTGRIMSICFESIFDPVNSRQFNRYVSSKEYKKLSSTVNIYEPKLSVQSNIQEYKLPLVIPSISENDMSSSWRYFLGDVLKRCNNSIDPNKIKPVLMYMLCSLVIK